LMSCVSPHKYWQVLIHLGQGTLTEGEGSVQLTSSLRQLVLKRKYKIFNRKSISSKQVSTRR
jgi:hypothetical protein